MTGPVVSLDERQAARLRRSRAVAGWLLVLAALILRDAAVPDPGGIVLLCARSPRRRWSAAGGLVRHPALFRRPLGLPIPHAAVVPANKDRIGEGRRSFSTGTFSRPNCC